MKSYIFDGSQQTGATGISYEEMKRRREMAQQLSGSIGTPRNVGEGLTAIGKALAARGMAKQAEREEQRMREEANQLWSNVSGGGDLDALTAAAGNPFIANNPGRSAVIGALINQRLNPPKPPKPIEVGGVLLDPNTFEPIFDSRTPDGPDTLKGADGYTYYVGGDRDGERVLPNVVAKEDGPLVDLDVDTGSRSEFWDKLNEKDANRVDQIYNEGEAARSQLANLGAAEQLALDPSIYTGTGADAVLQLKKLGRSLGFDVEGIESAEGFQAVARKSALDAMGGSLGAGFSDADRSFVTGQVAGLENTPEGNFIIIDVQRRIAQRKAEMADLVDQWRSNPNIPEEERTYPALRRMLNEYAEANPLFPDGYAEDVKARAAQATGGAMPPPPGADAGGADYDFGSMDEETLLNVDRSQLTNEQLKAWIDARKRQIGEGQ